MNAAGGISVGTDKRRVELVYYDYELNTPKSVQLAEKLVNDDKVDFMFAPFGSGSTKAASSVAEKYGIPMIASFFSSVEVYDQGYKNLFGVFTANDTLTHAIADLVSKKFQNIKKVAILARLMTFIHWPSPRTSRNPSSSAAWRSWFSKNTPSARWTTPRR